MPPQHDQALSGVPRETWCSGVHKLLNPNENTCVCVCVCVRAQSCPALWDPMDCSLPGSSIHGISQARILEWVAISSSRVCSWLKDKTYLLHLLHWWADSLPLCHKDTLTPLGENRKQRDSCFKCSVWVICRTGPRSDLPCFRPDRHFLPHVVFFVNYFICFK